MGNFDIKKMMKMLSSMSKEDLEKGIAQAKDVLNQKNSNDIINNLKNGKE